MPEPTETAPEILAAVRRPLTLTRAGMVAERLVRAFWPLWSILIAALAALMLGLHERIPVEAVWILGAVTLVAALAALIRGALRFAWPSREGALSRLDATLPGRPIAATLDRQAIGGADGASAALWRAHQARMRGRLAQARRVRPDLRVAAADPYALRYVALLALAVAGLFGSVMQVGSVTGMAPGQRGVASGPSWEGWVEPPAYTNRPTLYLNDVSAERMEVPENSRVTLRLYGETGALSVAETVSGAPLAATPDAAAATAQDIVVVQSGRLEVAGPGGRAWDIAMIPDAAPVVAPSGEIEATWDGEASIPFEARDDHAVAAGTARIELALDAVDRRFGLTAEPEPRPAIEMPLPLPVTGARDAFEEALIGNFSQHPWANLPVTITFEVVDGADQAGRGRAEAVILPGRRFFDPMAAALIEQRQALLWSATSARDVARILRAISHLPDDIFRDAKHYLRLRTLLRRLEAAAAMPSGLAAGDRDEIALALWDLAILLEDGDLEDARERLARAQERLNEAMKNGASEQEIAELMQELRQATDDYMRQLAQQAQREAEQNPDSAEAETPGEDMMQMSRNDLQEMMDRIQELMEEGRMAEAQQALEELQRMMENMRVTQGQGQPSPGEQAMEGLADTLREQQGLSDEAFRDLQEQFNPGQQRQGQNAQPGQQPPMPGEGQQPGSGEQQGEGQNPGQGQGQQPGQDQQGQGGEGQAQDGQPSMQEGLAERQRALRGELNRQRQSLPGAGTQAGDEAERALDRAEGAMQGAEEALEQDDYAGAIDRQSEAMEALREGMRNLGEAMAQEQGQQPGQEGSDGMAQGQQPGQQRDPLGRQSGSNGEVGSDESLLQGEDVYRRARELLDEIRRRSGEGLRPEEELDYLERLLERF